METGMISYRDSQKIRYAESVDRDFWLSLDRHIKDEELDRKIRDQMGYVLTVQNEPVGLLRYSLFWDNTPFCNLLYVVGDHQRKGYGRRIPAGSSGFALLARTVPDFMRMEFCGIL